MSEWREERKKYTHTRRILPVKNFRLVDFSRFSNIMDGTEHQMQPLITTTDDKRRTNFHDAENSHFEF